MPFSSQIGSLDFRYILILADAFGFRPTGAGWYQIDESPQGPSPYEMNWWYWEPVVKNFTEDEAVAASLALRRCLDFHLSSTSRDVPPGADCYTARRYEELRLFMYDAGAYKFIEHIQQIFAAGAVRWVRREGETVFIRGEEEIPEVVDDVLYEDGILVEGYDFERALCFAASWGFAPQNEAWQIQTTSKHLDFWWKRWREVAELSKEEASLLAEKLRIVSDHHLRGPLPSVPYEVRCVNGAEYNSYRHWVLSGDAGRCCQRLILACDLGALHTVRFGTQIRLRPNIDA